jgi:hypothetical protein
MRSNQNQSNRTEKTCSQSEPQRWQWLESIQIQIWIVWKNIESGEWIILLGSCDEEYELFVKNKSLYALNVGKGRIYLIDCKSGQHFCSNNWSVNQQKDNICFGHSLDHNIDSEAKNWQIVPIENRIKDVRRLTEDLLSMKTYWRLGDKISIKEYMIHEWKRIKFND